jgi:mRNA interferase RelE/StbE
VTYSRRDEPGVAKQLAKIDLPIRRRIEAVIETLLTNPHPPAAKALHGEQGVFRVRVAKDWRVIYRVDDKHLVVLVVRVGHRSDVYDQ